MSAAWPRDGNEDIFGDSGAINPGLRKLVTEHRGERETWKYQNVFYRETSPKAWIDVEESYYRAAHIMIEGVAKDFLNEDIEGIAGIYLFRHYLEVALKHLIIAGRWIKQDGNNAESIEKIGKIHPLTNLWKLALADAKPKLGADWKGLDTKFVAKCVEEFDGVDPGSFTFRYNEEGAENYRINFGWLFMAMEHVREVLRTARMYLEYEFEQNSDYESYLNSFLPNDEW
jgi:hypothetical protein